MPWRAAVPSPANADQYSLQYLTWAGANNIQSFYFEAFDETWKISSEGPQGAHWGIWDTTGLIKSGMGDSLCANVIETPTPPAITDLSGGGEMRHHGRRFEAQWRFPHDRVGGPGAQGGRAERALP